MDVEICKTSVMQTCPNCRRTYHDGVPATCPTCYQDGSIECAVPVVIVPSKRTPLSGCSNVSNRMINLYDWARAEQQHCRFRRFMCGARGSITFSADRDLYEPGAKTTTAAGKTCGNDNASSSPTAPLSLILSSVPLYASSTIAYGSQLERDLFFNSREGLHRIARCQYLLKVCGCYHRDLSWKGAIELLMPTPVGTFLIRDSSDPEYLYSLSVQTKCGPTSLRIHYSNGFFRLDADQSVAQWMPRYPCVLQLIQSYIESTKRLPLKCMQENENPAWQNVIGQTYSQIVLIKPMHAKGHLPSLKHLSRLCLNQILLSDPNARNSFSMPSHLAAYLKQYPYTY